MSTFGAEKFTTRSREAIETAQLAATTAGHTQTEPIHLLAELEPPRDAEAYLCGPAAFMDDMRDALTAAGVDPAHIHTELFAW